MNRQLLLVGCLILLGCSDGVVHSGLSPAEEEMNRRIDAIYATGEEPVLRFKHDDGWETEIYCHGGMKLEDRLQFITNCPHNDFLIKQTPPNVRPVPSPESNE